MTVSAHTANRQSAMRLFRVLVRAGVPLRRWARLEVEGLDVLPVDGMPLLIVSNHDSMFDPLAIADTMVRARRLVRFLAMDRLWRWRILAVIMDGLGQIPIRRGAGDIAAMQAAVEALAAGDPVCIFPEGGLSCGRRVRARRGVARLIDAVPHVEVVLAAVEGTTDIVRFPRRPRARVQLFRPSAPPRPGEEDHADLAERLMDEIRERVPPAAAGRRPGRRSSVQAPG
jgi:1-acyl-sn-glycerol-3-phosphate acyltransferase